MLRAPWGGRLRPAEVLGFELGRADFASEMALQRLGLRLEGAEVKWELIGPRLRFRSDVYCRNVLCRGRGFELVLCSWLPGQRSPIHGHGVSSGVVRLLAGVLRETCYEVREGRPEFREARTVRAGQVLIERPSSVHRVENASSIPAVTLHLYSPPLKLRSARLARVGHHQVHQAGLVAGVDV
jgi:quercetin dioxygenase-like cupin family protein